MSVMQPGGGPMTEVNVSFFAVIKVLAETFCIHTVCDDQLLSFFNVCLLTYVHGFISSYRCNFLCVLLVLKVKTGNDFGFPTGEILHPVFAR